MTESIASSGYPLGFGVRKGAARAPVIGGRGRAVFKAEARHFTAHHQKEAVVTEGDANRASAWRLVSDEGLHIKGDDLAPFPLGFYNAGLQADLTGRLITLARERGIALRKLNLQCVTGYSMTGSFYKGDGVGAAEPAQLQVHMQSNAAPETIKDLVDDAIAASPAFSTMVQPLINTFALYVNGARRAVTSVPASPAPDTADPLKTYSAPPSPLAGSATDLIVKTGVKRDGTIALAVPASQPGQPIVRHVEGHCEADVDRGLTTTRVCLQLPGMSEFALRSDEAASATAPSGLALLSAGIVFCYMTQLARYIDYLKLDIHHMRLVQFTPFACEGARGSAAPVDTHLFLHGNESDGTFEKLMRIAATTCFLHATLAEALPPQVTVSLNEKTLSI